MPLRLTTAGAAPWKLGLIPVLVAVLFKVTRTSPADVDPDVPLVEVDSGSGVAAAAGHKVTVLPELSLTDALRFDPFSSLPLPQRPVDEPPMVLEPPVVAVEPPVEPPAPKVNPLAERAATLKQLKVTAVFPSATGSMAIIDSKTVRVGDLLSPGVRVVEIRGTDVILRVENGEAAPSASSGGPAVR